MVDETGEPVLIDPAAYCGRREADLAMTMLFGGFEPCFYAAYEETWPLAPGAARDLQALPPAQPPQPVWLRLPRRLPGHPQEPGLIMATPERLVLVDGNALLYRAYHALPALFSTAKGFPTNAV